MAETVFVTGGTGFTGGHLCRHLTERGYEVRALARSTSDTTLLQSLGVEIVSGDLNNPESYRHSLNGVKTVYNIAALYRAEGVARKLFWQVNVEGTRNLLEAAAAAGVDRFVHCSTVGVQGEIKNPPATEDHPYNPGDVYQESKMEGEKLALRFFREHNLAGVVVRPVGIYGPGDGRFLKLFRYINNGKFRMFGSGNVLYHLTFVEDLVEGIILAGEKDQAVGRTYTLGGDQYVTLNELVGMIAEALGVEKPGGRLPVWPVWLAGLVCEVLCRPLRIEPPIYRRRVDFFIKDRAFDISKAKKELGYQPEVDLKTGLKITADWYRQQGWLD